MAASNLGLQGADTPVSQAVLAIESSAAGHRGVSTTMVYTLVLNRAGWVSGDCAVRARFRLLAKQRQLGTAAARRPFDAKCVWKLQDGERELVLWRPV